VSNRSLGGPRSRSECSGAVGSVGDGTNVICSTHVHTHTAVSGKRVKTSHTVREKKKFDDYFVTITITTISTTITFRFTVTITSHVQKLSILIYEPTDTV
jgi:hypothetical protein